MATNLRPAVVLGNLVACIVTFLAYLRIPGEGSPHPLWILVVAFPFLFVMAIAIMNCQVGPKVLLYGLIAVSVIGNLPATILAVIDGFFELREEGHVYDSESRGMVAALGMIWQWFILVIFLIGLIMSLSVWVFSEAIGKSPPANNENPDQPNRS